MSWLDEARARCEAAMSNPKTVRVRIAVAVGRDGGWNAYGCTTHGESDAQMRDCAIEFMPESSYETGYIVHFVEADVPLPTEAVVEGKVVGGDKSCG